MCRNQSFLAVHSFEVCISTKMMKISARGTYISEETQYIKTVDTIVSPALRGYCVRTKRVRSGRRDKMALD